MAEKSAMKMSYGKVTPRGVPAVNSGKAEMAPKVMKGARSAGEKYKAPKMGMKSGSARKGGSEKSSGNVSMMKQSASDKNRYTQAKQPTQYSNAGTPVGTKFIC